MYQPLLNEFTSLIDKPALASILKKKATAKKDIKVLQQVLFELGFGEELEWNAYGDDGDYGGGTAKAVLAFVTDNKLKGKLKLPAEFKGEKVTLKLANEIIKKLEIINLQQQLYGLGFETELKWERYGADGSYGPATKAAEKAFNKKKWPDIYNTEDGHISPQHAMASSLLILRNLLINGDATTVLSPASTKIKTITAFQTLLYYSSDTDQRRKININGKYGHRTIAAVKAFAVQENIPSDGQEIDISKVVEALINKEKFGTLRVGSGWPTDIMLNLGSYDEGLKNKDVQNLLKQSHNTLPNTFKFVKKNRIRQDNSNQFNWIKPEAVAGASVKMLQTFLFKAGLLPEDSQHGLFDYTTQAAVRMFQEYVNVYEEYKSMKPSGVVDERTRGAINQWRTEKKKVENWPRGKQSEEYREWIKAMSLVQSHYRPSFTPPGKKTDTLKVEEWTFNKEGILKEDIHKNDIHLIGIRRKANTSGKNRKNDDLFILLINGLVFKFWGSTDSYYYDYEDGEAFLAEGQHKYRFGWHNVSKHSKTYQGLNPYKHGVLVFRDKNKDKKFDQKDIELRIDPNPNTTINIHWTGKGHNTTWSQGCQVIAGRSYVDPLGKLRDCKDFAANGNKDLEEDNKNRIKKTKGAYNVFFDLLLLFAPQKTDHLYYTLISEETLSEGYLSDLKVKEIFNHTLEQFGLK